MQRFFAISFFLCLFTFGPNFGQKDAFASSKTADERFEDLYRSVKTDLAAKAPLSRFQASLAEARKLREIFLDQNEVKKVAALDRDIITPIRKVERLVYQFANCAAFSSAERGAAETFAMGFPQAKCVKDENGASRTAIGLPDAIETLLENSKDILVGQELSESKKKEIIAAIADQGIRDTLVRRTAFATLMRGSLPKDPKKAIRVVMRNPEAEMSRLTSDPLLLEAIEDVLKKQPRNKEERETAQELYLNRLHFVIDEIRKHQRRVKELSAIDAEEVSDKTPRAWTTKAKHLQALHTNKRRTLVIPQAQALGKTFSIPQETRNWAKKRNVRLIPNPVRFPDMASAARNSQQLSALRFESALPGAAFKENVSNTFRTKREEQIFRDFVMLSSSQKEQTSTHRFGPIPERYLNSDEKRLPTTLKRKLALERAAVDVLKRNYGIDKASATHIALELKHQLPVAMADVKLRNRRRGQRPIQEDWIQATRNAIATIRVPAESGDLVTPDELRHTNIAYHSNMAAMMIASQFETDPLAPQRQMERFFSGEPTPLGELPHPTLFDVQDASSEFMRSSNAHLRDLYRLKNLTGKTLETTLARVLSEQPELVFRTLLNNKELLLDVCQLIYYLKQNIHPSKWAGMLAEGGGMLALASLGVLALGAFSPPFAVIQLAATLGTIGGATAGVALTVPQIKRSIDAHARLTALENYDRSTGDRTSRVQDYYRDLANTSKKRAGFYAASSLVNIFTRVRLDRFLKAENLSRGVTGTAARTVYNTGKTPAPGISPIRALPAPGIKYEVTKTGIKAAQDHSTNVQHYSWFRKIGIGTLDRAKNFASQSKSAQALRIPQGLERASDALRRAPLIDILRPVEAALNRIKPGELTLIGKILPFFFFPEAAEWAAGVYARAKSKDRIANRSQAAVVDPYLDLSREESVAYAKGMSSAMKEFFQGDGAGFRGINEIYGDSQKLDQLFDEVIQGIEDLKEEKRQKQELLNTKRARIESLKESSPASAGYVQKEADSIRRELIQIEKRLDKKKEDHTHLVQDNTALVAKAQDQLFQKMNSDPDFMKLFIPDLLAMIAGNAHELDHIAPIDPKHTVLSFDAENVSNRETLLRPNFTYIYQRYHAPAYYTEGKDETGLLGSMYYHAYKNVSKKGYAPNEVRKVVLNEMNEEGIAIMKKLDSHPMMGVLRSFKNEISQDQFLRGTQLIAKETARYQALTPLGLQSSRPPTGDEREKVDRFLATKGERLHPKHQAELEKILGPHVRVLPTPETNQVIKRLQWITGYIRDEKEILAEELKYIEKDVKNGFLSEAQAKKKEAQVRAEAKRIIDREEERKKEAFADLPAKRTHVQILTGLEENIIIKFLSTGVIDAEKALELLNQDRDWKTTWNDYFRNER